MASIVLIHWLGAALGAWPPGRCANTTGDPYSRKGVGSVRYAPRRWKKCRKNEKNGTYL